MRDMVGSDDALVEEEVIVAKVREETAAAIAAFVAVGPAVPAAPPDATDPSPAPF